VVITPSAEPGRRCVKPLNAQDARELTTATVERYPRVDHDRVTSTVPAMTSTIPSNRAMLIWT
jgi:hypothetical protein